MQRLVLPATNTVWYGANRTDHGVGKPLHHPLQATTFEHRISVGHANQTVSVLTEVLQSFDHRSGFSLTLLHAQDFNRSKGARMP